MKLLLTSSGNTNKTIENALLRLLGKPFETSHLTFIPTAANIEKGDKGWLVDDMINFKKLGFKTFDIIDISAVGIDYWLPSFEKADILVFGGGNTHHLLTWMRKSGLEEVFPTLLQTKVYIGISAGSIVTAESISLSPLNDLYYEDRVKLNQTRGLGFVGFEVRPHLNSPYFSKVRLPYLKTLSEKMNGPFYAIDDNTAIQVVDREVSVISEGTWEKFN